MQRFTLAGVLLTLLAAGVCRVQLVACGQSETPTQQRENWEDQVAAFHQRLGQHPDLKEFAVALATPAGRIVLEDRVSGIEERLQEEARAEAVPRFFEKYFDSEGEGLVLRPGEEEFRGEVLRTVAGFNQDVGQIKNALIKLAQEVDAKSETDRLLVRFMNHESAAVMLYVEKLRERLRPDVMLVKRLLGRVFVTNSQGKYVVRPGKRPEVQEQLSKIQRARKELPALRGELQQWAKEIVEKDAFHKRVKKALAEPYFAAFIAAEIAGDSGGNISRRIEQFFHNLGEVAIDTAHGLEIVDPEQQQEIERALERYSQARKAAENLGGALKQFARNIDDGEALERGWKEVLASDIAIVRIGGEYEFTDADPQKIVRDMLREIWEEEEGRVRVRQDREEEVTKFIRNAMRQFRAIRLKGHSIEDAAKKIADPELREALLTPGGKFAVLYAIQNSLRNSGPDALSLWIDSHFEATDGKLVPKASAQAMLGEFLAQVKEVERELAQDDF